MLGLGLNRLGLLRIILSESSPTLDWILASGIWNDSGLWDDAATWND